MAFVYDERNSCYSMEKNDILFSCEYLDISFEKTANRLAEKYKRNLSAIAEYILNNEVFIETYGKKSEKELFEMLEEMTKPWIFLKDVNSGTIAYCDSDYVIEFSFWGDFEEFSDFSIDS